MATQAVDTAARLINQIDKAEPTLQAAIISAIIAARSAPGTLEEIAVLIDQGRLNEVLEVANRAGVIRISEGFAAVFTLAGKQGAEFLEDVLNVTVSFDQVNVRAVEIMRAEQLRLVTEFTAEQRMATRTAIVDGIERGLNPIQQAKNFRASIGLTNKQQQAVINYRRLLETGSSEALERNLRDARFDPTVRRAIKTGEPLTKVQIDRMVERYSERSVKHRSQVIARTEALSAVNAGNHEAYQQAIDQGVLAVDDLRREWHDASDARVRSSHKNLDGLIRGFDETFPGSNGELRFPGDPRAPASERVQCRCALSTRIDL